MRRPEQWDTAALRRTIASVTDPNVHSVSLRDMVSGDLLAIYRTEEEAARHALEHFKPGRVVEAIVWHPKTCDCSEVEDR